MRKKERFVSRISRDFAGFLSIRHRPRLLALALNYPDAYVNRRLREKLGMVNALLTPAKARREGDALLTLDPNRRSHG